MRYDHLQKHDLAPSSKPGKTVVPPELVNVGRAEHGGHGASSAEKQSRVEVSELEMKKNKQG